MVLRSCFVNIKTVETNSLRPWSCALLIFGIIATYVFYEVILTNVFIAIVLQRGQ